MSERYRPEPDRSGVEEMEAIAEEMAEEEEEIKQDLDPYHGPNPITKPWRTFESGPVRRPGDRRDDPGATHVGPEPETDRPVPEEPPPAERPADPATP